MPPEYGNLINFQRRLTSGRHKPPLVTAVIDNRHRSFVIKTNANGNEFPIAELICAELAAGFQIPMPAHALLAPSPGVLDVIEMAAEDVATELRGMNPLFGLEYLATTSVWQPTGNSEPDADFAVRLFLFDWFIGNMDRQPGNPNALFDGANRFAIDHGEALPWLVGAPVIGYNHAQHIGHRFVSPERITRLLKDCPILSEPDRIRQSVAIVPQNWWIGDSSTQVVGGLTRRLEQLPNILEYLP